MEKIEIVSELVSMIAEQSVLLSGANEALNIYNRMFLELVDMNKRHIPPEEWSLELREFIPKVELTVRLKGVLSSGKKSGLSSLLESLDKAIAKLSDDDLSDHSLTDCESCPASGKCPIQVRLKNMPQTKSEPQKDQENDAK